MPLQRSFSCAVLHFLQFMVAVSSESLCSKPGSTGSNMLAPICQLCERFGIFLAEFAAATQQVRDQAGSIAQEQRCTCCRPAFCCLPHTRLPWPCRGS